MTATAVQSIEQEKNYFDVAQGLYWFCVENHSGQWSTLYRISCTLDYHPGCMENGPDADSDASEVYAHLESLNDTARDEEAERLEKWIDAELERTRDEM
jgi:hypothetical protein